MSNVLGSAAYLQWIHPAGTAVMSTDHRSMSYTPGVDLIETTAGSDANKVYEPGTKSGSFSVDTLLQTVSATLETATVEGTKGTIIYHPNGTATGSNNTIKTFAAICMGAVLTSPYADVTAFNCSWTQNGARTDGTVA